MNDIRADLEAAANGDEEVIEEPEAPEVPEVEAVESEGRPRDEKGRFLPKTTEEPEQKPVEAEAASGKSEDEDGEKGKAKAGEDGYIRYSGRDELDVKTQDQVALAPPNGWTAEAKAKWHELPEEIQAAVNQREQDVHKQISKHDEERNFGRELSKVINPYLPQIHAEGGTPAAAVQSLLNTAYLLRTGTPDQKRSLLLQTARQFGVDLSQPEVESDVPPFINPLMQRLDRLEGHLTQAQQAEQTRIQTEVQSELQTFASDPAHPHYNEVKAHMAALLREGAASDLKDAYDQACWASPTIRTTLQAQERVKEDQKRKAAAKAQAEAAKRKNVSLNGGPGNTSTESAPEGGRSIRDELKAAAAAYSGAV